VGRDRVDWLGGQGAPTTYLHGHQKKKRKEKKEKRQYDVGGRDEPAPAIDDCALESAATLKIYAFEGKYISRNQRKERGGRKKGQQSWQTDSPFPSFAFEAPRQSR